MYFKPFYSKIYVNKTKIHLVSKAAKGSEYGKKRKYAKVLQSMQKYEKAEAGCAPGALSGAQRHLPGPSQGHLPGPSQGHFPEPRGTSQGPGAPFGLKQDGLHYDGSGTNCEESSL